MSRVEGQEPRPRQRFRREVPGRVANLVIIGVTKAGTSSLFTYLSQHPDICGSKTKEVRYFAPLLFGGGVEPIEAYASNFTHCVGFRYALEATPDYFYGGRPLAASLNETSPDARVVLSLRSPVDRFWSWFRFVKALQRIPVEMTPEDYFLRCKQLVMTGEAQDEEKYPYWGLRGGCYDLWLPSWTAEFGGRLSIVSFEELASNAKVVTRALCDWLDIDQSPVDDFDFQVENETLEYRLRWLQRLAVRGAQGRSAALARRPTVRRWLRTSYRAINGRPGKTPSDVMSEGLKTQLHAFYKPHNVRLAHQLELAGVALPTWLQVGS